jgi:L-ascorbate metabolism protein UlaG (beta-lactamase superfamily)
MQIHFIRNATLVIEVGAQRILVDPMLGPKSSLPPFAFFRHRARRNPTVDLPPNIAPVLSAVSVGLITHCRRGHFDHLDRTGYRHLAQQGIPTYCNHLDENHLRQRGIMTVPLTSLKAHEFLGGSITPFETAHGYGWVGQLMGPGLGYAIALPDAPRLYISGDTVLTPIVKDVLMNWRPDVAILAAGSASLDIGKPILMPMPELLDFIHLSPGIVIATHMEALNHCPVTRGELRKAVTEAGLIDKVRIPLDGEIVVI